MKVGFEAAAILDQLMKGKCPLHGSERILIPPRGIVSRRSTDVRSNSDSLVADVQRFIREHACEDMNVKTLLQRFPTSRAALFRRFKEATGRTPHEEILRIRVERAQYLLLHTDRSVAQVARLVGFEHPEYLGAVFQRRLGISPGRYREQHRPKESL